DSAVPQRRRSRRTLLEALAPQRIHEWRERQRRAMQARKCAAIINAIADRPYPLTGVVMEFPEYGNGIRRRGILMARSIFASCLPANGGTMDRPALKSLLGDITAGKVDVVVVYKIDRLTRSLFDFAKIVEIFDAHKVSFVSVTQSFNTTTSMGRLTLNVLMSFAQFEREVTGERIRHKVAASKKKGMWMG